MSHIVYLLPSALTARDIDRFGMEAMRARGHEVTVLDVADLCHPTLQQDRNHYATMETFRPTVVADSGQLLAQAPLLAQADLIFCLVTTGMITRPTYPILRLIAQSGTPWGLICSNSIPGIRNYRGDMGALHKRVKDIVARRRIINPMNSLLARTPRAALGLRPADFAVFGGSESMGKQQLFGPGTRAIMAHAHDYDAHLAQRDEPVTITDTAVFLDQYLPHHRDWVLLGVETVVDRETYYPQLRLLFDRIEHELGLEVVIAAHPRADYSEKPGVFGNRRIVYGRTDRLTRASRLVLNFTSLAVNFAVFAHKPVLLLATDLYYASPAGRRYTDPMATELGLPVVFLEKAADADLSHVLSVDDALYDRYIRTYVKMPGSPERPYWDIVTDALQGYGFLPGAIAA